MLLCIRNDYAWDIMASFVCTIQHGVVGFSQGLQRSRSEGMACQSVLISKMVATRAFEIRVFLPAVRMDCNVMYTSFMYRAGSGCHFFFLCK